MIQYLMDTILSRGTANSSWPILRNVQAAAGADSQPVTYYLALKWLASYKNRQDALLNLHHDDWHYIRKITAMRAVTSTTEVRRAPQCFSIDMECKICQATMLITGKADIETDGRAVCVLEH